MAKTVDANVLRELRHEKGWSLKDLADRAKVDKKTIHMLERGKRPGAQQETINRLCRELGVSEAVLTGLTPRPRPEASDPINPKSQFNTRIDTAARNAVSLVALRYGVTASQIVELAPFLFFWAAERSLKRRKERLNAVEQALWQVEEMRERFPHLPNTGFCHDIESLHYEERSIEKRDLFAAIVDEAPIHQSDPNYDEASSNPFAAFLKEVATEVEDAAFEGMYATGSPAYTVCREDAAVLVDADEQAVEAIMTGAASVQEMFKELKGGTAGERAAWAKERLAESRRDIDRWLGEISLDLDLGEAKK